MDIKGNAFLITGGAGLMGSHIAERLVAAGARKIILLDNMVRGSMDNIKHLLPDPRVTFVNGDIRSLDLMRDVATGINGVFHMAALRITACAADPREAMEVMLLGLHNVLQVIVEKQVGRLLYASSASIYGLADSFPTSETHPPYNNRTYYGAAKIAGEGMARAFAEMYGINYVALRYFNVYGPRMDMHGKYTEVLVRWMDRIEQGEPPMIFGTGSQTMDLVNIADVTDANILAMQSGVTDEVFNIASGTETSLLELLNVLLRATGSNLKPAFLPERSVNPVPRRLADVEKAERVLGFKAKVELEEGLKQLVVWRQSAKMVQTEAETVAREDAHVPVP
ncbi:NAD-dependent epimerase/dehydratase family protein [Geomesophilobacter sediminis]|uniref:NAD-dependent epimerase/dehydratase family protein n=1 Tax=Geomesophilobacter sediminis TaxID=2798584 RepID=A0A8J7M236_9BACT|nr:NAD-dependent epimerase/dehydratase family protein [Geomesophilobacter sediminis]MBJ6727089.1 NAD-dependent epimerase/dehydratase family protein [Geomesophilobacter sediminis]